MRNLGAPQTPSKLHELIEATARAMVRGQGIPGLSVHVRRGDETLYAGGFGIGDLGEARPVRTDTIYSIASVTKQFTAALILQLELEGLLRLDQSLAHYVPQIPGAANIRLEHLLNNTSGIVGYTEYPSFYLMPHSPITAAELAELAARHQPIAEAGSRWHYSNTSYILLGLIAERVAAQPLGVLFGSRFFRPLGMMATSYEPDHSQGPEGATGYTSVFLGPPERAETWDDSWAYAAGGIRSTVDDLVKWSIALRSGAVVGLTGYARMTEPARVNGGTHPYGYGLHIDRIGDYLHVHHAGMLPGFVSQLSSIPEMDIDIAILTNYDVALPVAGFVEPCVESVASGMRYASVPPAASAVFTDNAAAERTEATMRSLLAGAPVVETAAFADFLTRERSRRLRALALDNVQIRFFARSERPPVVTYMAQLRRPDGESFEAALGILDEGVHTFSIKPWMRRHDYFDSGEA